MLCCPCVCHRPTSFRRAQKFPEATSRRIELSSACSATSCFSRAYSRLQLLQPLRLVDPHPAVLATPAVVGLLTHPELAHRLAHRIALGEVGLCLPQLGDDLLSCVPLPLARPDALWGTDATRAFIHKRYTRLRKQLIEPVFGIIKVSIVVLRRLRLDGGGSLLDEDALSGRAANPKQTGGYVGCQVYGNCVRRVRRYSYQPDPNSSPSCRTIQVCF